MPREFAIVATAISLTVLTVTNAGSVPLQSDKLVRMSALPPVRLVRTRLPCDSSGIGSGSCPSQNKICHEECDTTYAAEILACLAGVEGILPYQRTLCYGKASVRMGMCHRECDNPEPG